MKWHPIKSDKDLPRRRKWVLVSTQMGVDIAKWDRYESFSDPREASWDGFARSKPWYVRVSAWAELPKPYKG